MVIQDAIEFLVPIFFYLAMSTYFLILKAKGLQQRKACALFCGSQTEPNVKMTCWRWQFLGSGSGPCALIMAIMDVWKARAARTPLGDSLTIFPGCTGARRKLESSLTITTRTLDITLYETAIAGTDTRGECQGV